MGFIPTQMTEKQKKRRKKAHKKLMGLLHHIRDSKDPRAPAGDDPYVFDPRSRVAAAVLAEWLTWREIDELNYQPLIGMIARNSRLR